MTKVVDKDEALALLERAVEDKGRHYVDPNSSGNCSYADEDGNPLCIVGHVVHYLGVDLRPVVTEDPYYGALVMSWGEEVDALTLNGAQEFAPLGDVQFTEAAARALFNAQKEQDNGASWGDALSAARGD